MAGPNTPKAGPIVTERLLLHGAKAELKELASTINVDRERDHVRRLNADDRSALQAQIKDWKYENRDEEHTEQSQAVLRLLDELKLDIEQPDTGYRITGGGLGAINYGVDKTVEGVVGYPTSKAVEGYTDLARYARDETARIANAGSMQEKIGMTGKNVLLFGGIAWATSALFSTISSGIDKMWKPDTWTNSLSHAGKWILGVTGIGWLANTLLRKGKEPDAKVTAPPPRPSVAKERTPRPSTYEELSKIPEGRNLLEDLTINERGKTEGRVEFTVDGSTVTILPPVNDKNEFSPRFQLDGVEYALSPAPGAPDDPLAKAMDDVVKSLMNAPNGAPNRDAREALANASRKAAIERRGDVIRAGIKGGAAVELKISDIQQLVKGLKQFPDTTEFVDVPFVFQPGNLSINRRFSIGKTGAVEKRPAPAPAPAAAPAAPAAPAAKPDPLKIAPTAPADAPVETLKERARFTLNGITAVLSEAPAKYENTGGAILTVNGKKFLVTGNGVNADAWSMFEYTQKGDYFEFTNARLHVRAMAEVLATLTSPKVLEGKGMLISGIPVEEIKPPDTTYKAAPVALTFTPVK